MMGRKRRLGWIAVPFLWALPAASQSAALQVPWQAEEHRQFDFWLGTWDVNLRIKQPDLSWKDSVAAKVEIYRILDGKAILELWDSPSIKGFSLRYFDPQKQKWVLHLNWPSNSRSSLGSLEGSFRHGRGEFYSGPAIGSPGAESAGLISRYTFSDITPSSLRWDDAFSSDGGKTWTHNWVMEFARSAELATWPADSVGHTFESGARCVGDAFDGLNSMAGSWMGEASVHGTAATEVLKAKMKVYHVLDGCSVLRFLTLERADGSQHRSFGLLTYNGARGGFEELSLDNRPGTPARVHRGPRQGEALTLDARATLEGKPVLLRHRWSLPDEEDQLRLESSINRDGKTWTPSLSLRLSRVEALEPEPHSTLGSQAVPGSLALNERCPRSGERVVADSLTQYRGRTVGFCNTHCRDDFAANVGERPADERFFDRLIDGEED